MKLEEMREKWCPLTRKPCLADKCVWCREYHWGKATPNTYNCEIPIIDVGRV